MQLFDHPWTSTGRDTDAATPKNASVVHTQLGKSYLDSVASGCP